MINIPGNAVAKECAGKKISAEGFFVITYVYFQNLTIKIVRGNLRLS